MQDGTLKVAKIEDHRPQPQTTATHTITYVLDGFQITSVIETSTPIRDVVSRLRAIGAEPPSVQNAAKPTNTPVCPIHNTPMKASRKPGKYYCARKAEDGEYCRETA